MASCNAQSITDEHGDRYLHVSQDALIVESTKNILDWESAADGTKRIPIHQAIQHLLIGNKLFPPSSRTTDITMLTFDLNDPKWASIIDAQTSHGAYNRVTRDPLSLKAQIMRAMLLAGDYDRLISSEDVERADPFDLPEQQGPEELKFLALAPVTSLISDEGPSMSLICELAGMLGHGTNAARRQEGDSDVRIMAAILLPAIHKYLGFNNAISSSAVLATQIKPLLTAAALDGVLRSGETDTITLRNDWVDAFRYALAACKPHPKTLSHSGINSWSPRQLGME